MNKKLYNIKMLDGRIYREYLSGANDEQLKDELLKKFGVWFCLMINTVTEVII